MPIFGPLFSSTIGTIINPPQKMHLEYWQQGFQVNPADEAPSTLLTEGKLYKQPFNNYGHDINVYNQVQQQAATANAVYQEGLSASAYQAKQVVSKSYIENEGITFQQRSILPTRTYDRYNTPYKVYSTPSGMLNVVDVPDELNLYNVNEDLQRWSLNKVLGTNQRVEVSDISGPGIPVGNDSPAIDNAFVYGLGEQYNWLGEIAGLKGFALQQFVTGHGNENARVIDTSGYSYGFSDAFWEENMGGLGANMSEIVRRFIPKRNNNTEYVNPIRNTMPSWMPGSNYFTDFKHGDPYSKIMNGEERLPGEGYERLHNIKGLMEFNIGSSSIGYEKDYIIKHMLKADKYTSAFEEDTLDTGNEVHKAIQQAWLDAGIAIDVEGKVEDKRNGIIGWYDAKVYDYTSPTGTAIVDIKTTSAKKLEEIRKTGKPLTHHMRQTNFYLWATNTPKGYIYYVDKENPMNTYTAGFDFSRQELETSLNNVYEARQEIRRAVERGEIGRGELYSPLDQFRILADVAPYSQEFADAKARISSEALTPEEKQEVSQINARVTAQKEPLRVYDYKFKTSNLKTETVTVTKVIDNNTIVTREYGKKHAVKLAGINVSQSNSEMYDENRTKAEAASEELHKFVRPGKRITISYDADPRNKFSKDSTQSIRAVITSGGTNVNHRLLEKGMATEKENDNSPAAIHARYTKGEIAFGSAMETITHDVVSRIPFFGSKMMQVRSPYESYRQREVYGKDFQSWNNPIRDILIPHIETNIADNSLGGLGGIITGAFIGSLFGAKNNKFGKIVGATIGAAVPAVGKIAFIAGTDSERDWRPKRRRDQEELNEYVDTLKYVKNMRLYEQYKTKALKEDHFDVERFMESKESAGVTNKLKSRELTDYKRKVKLDFKHRDNYNFKYGKPKYVEDGMSKEQVVSAINQEITEIQSQRKVTKVPVNAMKAIEFKQAADQTMYGYNPGDSLVNIMSALPKKDRQYFKHFVDAPEEEKEKILRIAPKYMRRALQSAWGKTVDKKPTLNEYFMTHGLPDASWIGWSEQTNLDDVKVKLVHKNNLDPGEFDIWADNEEQADAVNIPIPNINARNSGRETQMKLQQILGQSGYNDVQVMYTNGHYGNSTTTLNIMKDNRQNVESQIAALQA
jgi:endonuclease YncB( thermonuclease family)